MNEHALGFTARVLLIALFTAAKKFDSIQSLHNPHGTGQYDGLPMNHILSARNVFGPRYPPRLRGLSEILRLLHCHHFYHLTLRHWTCPWFCVALSITM
ncbi:hypothetical protein EDD16DRAFT_1630301 [Pisolithus croceorrhizus]|nr:hypothetical protein EDD16DRAFT_1630301 [Pisolithus croceorrhizus]